MKAAQRPPRFTASERSANGITPGAQMEASSEAGAHCYHRWGCFESIQLDGQPSSLRAWLVHNGVRWRTHAFGAPYGDQAIFVERSTFR